MLFDIIVQVIGFVAIAFGIISVQFNRHSTIVLMKTGSSFLFGVQYFLLGAYTGVVLEFIGWIRNFVFIHLVKNGKNTKPWIILFSLITIATGLTTIILSWNASLKSVAWLSSDYSVATILSVSISILAIFAKVLSTVAYGVSDPHKIRMLNIPTCSSWIVYNFVAFSIAGIINEIMCLSSIAIAELRFKKAKIYPNSNNGETTNV